VPGVRELPTTVSAREALRRALRLRCPRCGRGVLFDGWFAMRETCDACGLRFEREPGYFVGAIYVNYAVTAVACLGTAIGLDLAFGLGVWTQVAIAVAIAVLVPVLFFRYARSLWLGLDHVVTSADETAERRSRKPR
jgi:uncharacterized protein (DUF983 family)